MKHSEWMMLTVIEVRLLSEVCTMHWDELMKTVIGSRGAMVNAGIIKNYKSCPSANG